jgi:hexosaminidase
LIDVKIIVLEKIFSSIIEKYAFTLYLIQLNPTLMSKRILKISGIVVFVLILASLAAYFFILKPKDPSISVEDRAKVSLMPLPSQLKLGNGSFVLEEGIGIVLKGPEDQVVSNSLDRFKSLISQKTGYSFSDSGKGIAVVFKSVIEGSKPMEADESYEINIGKSGVELTANSGYGVLRGLETLKQLLVAEEDDFYLPFVKIKDSPRYLWRGLMIDVCRHWIPKEVILRNLEAMASVKMNVFHWHLSEHQAFRVESKVFPKLHELGSRGNYYTQEDIKEIVAFAGNRGIRVIPEFDIPGHATSYLVGYPELAAIPGPYQLQDNFGLATAVMDPSKEEVYRFLDQFIEEMATLFPDPYFHIGGDEVDFSDWDKNPSIVEFKAKNNIENNHDLQAYFNQRVEQILTKHGKKMVGWDEITNPHLSKDIVVQSWRDQKTLFHAVQSGFQGILSAGLYLDHKLPAAKHYAVNPEILPGAVTIEPDSLLWEHYKLDIYIGENPLKSEMVLYGEGENLRGVLGLMENFTGFEDVQKNADELSFNFESPVGMLSVESVMEGDSISGEFSVMLLSFPFKGVKIGSDKMPGTVAPKVEKMEPLTEAEKKYILGGEAAMWSELVDLNTIDSRIWPRTGAIAEKLWSPQEATTDVKDMYRRLEILSGRLEQLGLRHLSYPNELIHELAEGKDAEPGRILIEVLEESKYLSRLNLDRFADKALNEVADAAQAESLAALKFSWMVDQFLEENSQQLADQIENQLHIWKNNHDQFVQVAKGNPKLELLIPTSEELAIMSAYAIQSAQMIQSNKKVSKTEKADAIEKISKIDATHAGTVLAVEASLKKLINAMPED